jgi:hypothetical protein
MSNLEKNRELNIEYQNLTDICQDNWEINKYDFSAVDFALRTMVTYSGFQKDQNSYQKMKEMYE